MYTVQVVAQPTTISTSCFYHLLIEELYVFCSIWVIVKNNIIVLFYWDRVKMANAQRSPTERTPPITTECQEEKGHNDGREELVTSAYTWIKRRQQQQYLEDIKEKTVQKLLPQVTGTPTASTGTTAAATGTKSTQTETEVMKRLFNLPSFKQIPKEMRERMMEEMRGQKGSDDDDDASSGYQSVTSSLKSL
ncbi:PREDICTED: uncharacterized protein LOC109585283 [Amphimedon queenslandica]|nr:PREDICTED: uncharacterized protein LOC109585283 [Amphimedon queenslandica]|eukprot:XP_019856844.1 PREDICTED: uncharacterized protein LOC109585283 [Amphimedon queenslandica]